MDTELRDKLHIDVIECRYELRKLEEKEEEVYKKQGYEESVEYHEIGKQLYEQSKKYAEAVEQFMKYIESQQPKI